METLQDSNLDVTMDNQQPSILSDKVDEGSTTRDDTSLVTCRICGKQGKDLNSHIHRVHKISTKEYCEKYNEKYVVCESVRMSRGQAMKKGYTPEYRSQVCSHAAKCITPESRHKNGLRIHQYLKDHPEAEIARGKKVSEGYHRRMENDPQFVLDMQERMRNAASVWHKKVRDMSDEELQNFLNRSFLGHPKFKVYEYKGKSYLLRSGYEFKFLKYLIDNNISYEYEPKMIHFEKFRYIPDFLIGDTIVEVKFNYWISKDPEQLQMRKICSEANGYKFLVLTEDHLWSEDKMQEIIGELSMSAEHS